MTYYTTSARGILTTSSTSPYGILSTRRVRDVSNEIALLDSNNTALLTLLRKLRKMKSVDPKFEWFEDIFPTQTTTPSGSESSTSTTIDVDTGTGLLGRAGDLWLNGDSGEVFYIVSVLADAWTVVRGIGSTDATDMVTGDNLFYIGNAQDQGAAARAQLATQTVAAYNYCQLFKEPFEVTNTAAATKLYGGPDLVYLRQKHGQIHNRDIERMLWFGVRDDLVTADAANIVNEAYMSRGLLADGTNGFITSNTSETNSSGEYTEDEFEVDLQTAFRYGNAVKFCFASPTAITTINSWGRDKLQSVPRTNTWGVNITRYVSAHGELNIINNKLFADMSGAGSTWAAGLNYSECAVILDLENLYYRFLRDTVLEQGIQGTDVDSMEEQYLTECGLMCKQEKTHMDIYGFRLS